MKLCCGCSTTTILILSLFITILSNLLVTGIQPPKIDSYAKVNPKNGKIIIDKDFLESVRYPPIIEFLFWLVPGNGIIAQTFLPFTIESLISSARNRVNLPKDAAFWIDKEANETLTGPPGEYQSYSETYWMKHLVVLLDSINNEALPYLSIFGRIVARDNIVETLKMQLKIVHLLKQHPEILDEIINRPIVITGPPRTMTTHTQSILAHHPDILYLNFAEGKELLPPDGLNSSLVNTDKDPRYKIINYAVVILNLMRPLFYYMFRFDTEKPGITPNEDIFLSGLVFGTPLYEAQMYTPTFSRLWHTPENKSAYRFQKICQQILQWQRRILLGLPKNHPSELRKRWLMKSPEHVGFLRDLISVYPDALVVLTHRDPVPVVESFIPLVTYMAGFWNSHIDAPTFASFQLSSLKIRLNDLVDQIDVVPSNQLLHVPFKDFLHDNRKWIFKICEFAGISTSDEAKTQMVSYIERSPREGANRFEYQVNTCGENFQKENLKMDFKNYLERFKEYI